MRRCFRFLLLGLFSSGLAHGQGPAIDPSFTLGQVYAPGTLRQAVQQPDGKRVLVGTFNRVAGAAVAVPGAYSLARLLAGGTQLDATFQANTAGLQGELTQAVPLANGQLLVVGQGRGYPLRLGSLTRRGLLRLNADGTADAGFDLGAAIPSLLPQKVVEQPDGKLLVAGLYEAANGAQSPALVRLNANGTADPSFQPTQSGGLNGPVTQLVLQADGKVIVGGTFTAVQGQTRRTLARLLPTGALDASFDAALAAGTAVGSLALQADGNLLALLGSGNLQLRRLLPSGAADATWQTGTGFSQPGYGIYFGALAVQPDGGVLVSTSATLYNGTPIGRLVRLLPTGALDGGFANLAAAPLNERYPLSVQALPGGQVLAAGLPLPYGSPGASPTPLAVLTPSGAVLPTAAPAVLQPGAVFDVARLPNGQLLVGGNFTEIGGMAAGYVARLNADDTPDAAFATACNGAVHSVVTQADGKMLLGGRFSYVAGVARAGLARLQPTGPLDVVFAPPLQPSVVQPFGEGRVVRQVAVQPDGNLLLSGYFNLRGSAAPPQVLARVLSATGQRDATFVPADSTGNFSLAVQADGRILVGGVSWALLPTAATPVLAWRLLASGALDPSFALTPVNSTGNWVNLQEVTPLATDASGRIYVGGRFGSYGSVPTQNVARLLPSGVPDASFTAAIAGTTYNVGALAVQPNGRLLVGAAISRGGQNYGLVRLLATGAEDVTFALANGPGQEVLRLLVQPDGALVAAGTFQQVSSIPVGGIVRLLDANVLSVSTHRGLPQLSA